MRKKSPIIGGIVAVIVLAVIVASVSLETPDAANLDMQRSHGTVLTAMGSPIAGDPGAPNDQQQKIVGAQPYSVFQNIFDSMI